MNIVGVISCASALSLLAGCAGKNVRPSPVPAHGPAAVAARCETLADRQVADVDSAVAAIVARCDAVQLASDIPVACQVDVVDDIARMQLTMANQAAAQRYLVKVYSELARPFCNLANQEAARAGIVVSLYEEQLMQVVDCVNGHPSRWQPVDLQGP